MTKMSIDTSATRHINLLPLATIKNYKQLNELFGNVNPDTHAPNERYFTIENNFFQENEITNGYQDIQDFIIGGLPAPCVSRTYTQQLNFRL